jgi:hypothetical protein
MLPVTVSAVHDSSRPPAVLTSWPQHHALGRWLAKHVRLCSSVDIKLTRQSLPTINSQPPSPQQAAAAFDVLNAVVAAGWQAAARGPSSAGLIRTTRQQAASAALLYPPAPAATTAAVTAAILGSSSRSGQALPLTAFASSMPSGEQVLLAMAGSTQLTRLELRLSDTEVTSVCARAALSSLTSLKELVLGQHSAERGIILRDVAMYCSLDALHPALPSLTCLTCCAFGGVPTQQFLDVFPVGLVELKLGWQLAQGHGSPVWGLAHLTNVTKLQFTLLLSESVLPPLVCLFACKLFSVQPLLPLRHLKRLSIRQPSGMDVAVMQQLSVLTHVSYFSATCRPWRVGDSFDMSDLLPLKKLTLQTFPGYHGGQVDRLDCCALFGRDLAQLNHQSGLVQHLTCLVLQDLRLLRFDDSLGLQLKKFPALEELRLVRVYALLPLGTASCGNECATVWKEFVCGVSGLKSLRSFIACEVELGGVAAGLAAATQLTYCELVGCGVGEAAEAELRARLPQLSCSRLVVR